MLTLEIIPKIIELSTPSFSAIFIDLRHTMASTGYLQDSDFLDAEPLLISGESLGLEGLHCMLEDYELEDNEIEDGMDEEDVDYFPFAHFNSSYIMDSTDILGNSRIHENQKVHYTSSISATPDPSSIPQLAQCEKRRFIPMNAITFDPPTSIHVRQASHSDVSMSQTPTPERALPHRQKILRLNTARHFTVSQNP